MSWEKIRIGDVCEITSSKRIFYSDYMDKGVPFYRSKEIIEKSKGEEINTELYISQEKYNLIKQRFGVPKIGDILLTAVGTIGIPYLVSDDKNFYFKDGNLIWLRDFSGKIEPLYLKYWLETYHAKQILNNVTIGSSQKALTIQALKRVEIIIPEKNVQKKIVDILSAYDDLIENNKKQIKLLEEAAQRLYKEWFVDLHFPGYENTKIIEGIPEGWKKSSLEEICELQETIISVEELALNCPYIGLEHMPRKDFCLASFGQAQDSCGKKYFFEEDDIIFAKIRPYFHKVGFAITSGVVSLDSFVIKSQKGFWGLLLMTMFSEDFVNYSYRTCKEGAKMPRADWNQMKKYYVKIPDDQIRKEFEENIWSITRQIKVLAFQNKKLLEARDRLSPKLIQGEIDL